MSFLPLFSCIFIPNLIVSSIKLPTYLKSSLVKFLVTNAAVPILIPPGLAALLSPNTEFLFSDISTNSHIYSTLLPLMFLFAKLIKIKWLSVPSDTKLYPLKV